MTVSIEDDEDPETDDEEIALVIHNADSLAGYIACSTQWRTASARHGLLFVGLDYTACKTVLDAEAFPAQVFADLRVIEDAVLPIFNDRDMPIDEDDAE